MQAPASLSGKVSKKVRRREEEPPNDGGDEVMTEEGRSKPFSFRDAVLNSGSMNSDKEDHWVADDLVLQEMDVRKTVEDGIPTIDFSNRVYGMIDESMSKTPVVKLLGRKIGYNALWNKICALWKPSMHFQLMDIENDYYLAKFEAKSDYHNVIVKRLWVIYGHHLTVQPWSSQFSTLEVFPQCVIAWIRILGLLCAFYKRSILQEIEILLEKSSRLISKLIVVHEANLLDLLFK